MVKSTAADPNPSPAQPNSHCTKLLTSRHAEMGEDDINLTCALRKQVCVLDAPVQTRSPAQYRHLTVQQEPTVVFWGSNNQILN